MIQTLTGTKAVYGSEVESKIIEFTIVGADEIIAEKLGVSVGDFVYKIIRLRIIHSIPTIMEHTWMPISVIPGVEVSVLEDRSTRTFKINLVLKWEHPLLGSKEFVQMIKKGSL